MEEADSSDTMCFLLYGNYREVTARSKSWELLLDVQMHLDIGCFKLETSSTKSAWLFLGQKSESSASGDGEGRQHACVTGTLVSLPVLPRASCPAREADGKLCLTKQLKYVQDKCCCT